MNGSTRENGRFSENPKGTDPRQHQHHQQHQQHQQTNNNTNSKTNSNNHINNNNNCNALLLESLLHELTFWESTPKEFILRKSQSDNAIIHLDSKTTTTSSSHLSSALGTTNTNNAPRSNHHNAMLGNSASNPSFPTTTTDATLQQHQQRNPSHHLPVDATAGSTTTNNATTAKQQPTHAIVNIHNTSNTTTNKKNSTNTTNNNANLAATAADKNDTEEQRQQHYYFSHSSSSSTSFSTQSQNQQSHIHPQQHPEQPPPPHSPTLAQLVALCPWHTAVDPATGRTYYYDADRRQSQWEKPRQIRAIEKKAKKEQRLRLQIFFREMESNLLASLARGERIPLQKRVAKEGPPLEPEPTTYDTASESSSNSNVTSKQGQPLATSTTTTRVRTISGMNEHLLAQLQQQQHHPMQSSRLSVGNSPSNYHGAVEKGRPPLPRPPPTLSSSIPPTTTITLNVVSQKPQNGGAAPMSLSISPANSSGSSYNNNNTTTSVDTNRDNGRVATRVEAPPTSDANSQRRQHIEKQFSMNELELSPEEDHAKQPFGDDSLRGEALLDRLLVDLEVSDDEEDDSSRNAESDPRGVISPSEDMTTESFTISGSHAVGNSMSNSSSSTDNTSDKRALAPLSHIRRNTAGNVAHAKAGTTMDKPDIDGTIHVVCGVIRVHMEEYLLKHRQQRSAIGSSCPTLGKFNLDIFRDDYETNVEPRRDSRSSSSPSYSNKALPSLEEIKSFYHEFFKRSQMEFDAIIMSLIYVERLVKETNGALMPTPDNWGSVVFSCMVLASKVWDDLSMWNIDFSNVSVNSSLLSSFSLKRINQLELGVLTCLNFAVTIPGSEYAKYYYLLRNMMIRGGLLDPFAASQTLTKDEKSRFEDRTTRYQEFKLNQDDLTRRRVKSVDWSQLASSSSKTSTGVVSSEFAVPGKTSSGHHFHLLEPLSDPLQHQPLSLGQLIATSKAT